jgi:cytochrome c553
MKKISLFILSSVAIGWFAGPALAEDISETWDRQCKKCHGEDGSGQTKMGKKLSVLDYTDPAVQAELTDEEMIRVIKEGAVNDAGKTIMKPLGETMTDEEIAEFIPLIRGFAKD